MNGSALRGRKIPRGTLAERFWIKVDKVNGPILRKSLGRCWIWTGTRDEHGYGQIYRLTEAGKAKWEKAPRVAFFLKHGRWPTPCSRHKCDNPSCVRHIIEGTYADNAHDRDRRGRHVALSGAKNGMYGKPELVARGERSGKAQLTDAKVRLIRLEFARGAVTKTSLALKFGVHRRTILRVLEGRTWTHV